MSLDLSIRASVTTDFRESRQFPVEYQLYFPFDGYTHVGNVSLSLLSCSFLAIALCLIEH